MDEIHYLYFLIAPISKDSSTKVRGHLCVHRTSNSSWQRVGTTQEATIFQANKFVREPNLKHFSCSEA